jgi:hypothetical protein
MVLSKRKKIWLGVASFTPVILSGMMFCWMFVYAFLLSPQEALSPDWIRSVILILIGLIVSLAQVVLIIYFATRLIRNNPSLNDSEKTIWTIVVALMGMVAIPIYWYHHVWLDRSDPKFKTD